MSKTIFIATAEPYSGKSLVALGIVNMLLGKARKVGYFKPIINYDPKEKKDPHIDTIVQHFNLPIVYEDAYAFTRRQVMRHPISKRRRKLHKPNRRPSTARRHAPVLCVCDSSARCPSSI